MLFLGTGFRSRGLWPEEEKLQSRLRSEEQHCAHWGRHRRERAPLANIKYGYFIYRQHFLYILYIASTALGSAPQRERAAGIRRGAWGQTRLGRWQAAQGLASTRRRGADPRLIADAQTDSRPRLIADNQTDSRPRLIADNQTDSRPRLIAGTQTDSRPRLIAGTQTDSRPRLIAGT
jgi:hypothetical protein